MQNQIQTAAQLFLARQSRAQHPSGHFDKASRWDPDQSEHRPCCNAVRTPSRAFPWSLMVHCRTAKHIARLTGVDESAIKRTANAIKRAEQSEHASAMQVVKADYDF